MVSYTNKDNKTFNLSKINISEQVDYNIYRHKLPEKPLNVCCSLPFDAKPGGGGGRLATENPGGAVTGHLGTATRQRKTKEIMYHTHEVKA